MFFVFQLITFEEITISKKVVFGMERIVDVVFVHMWYQLTMVFLD
jgi:hypothetical protein